MLVEIPQNIKHWYGGLESYDTDKIKTPYMTHEESDYYNEVKVDFVVEKDDASNDRIHRWEITYNLGKGMQHQSTVVDDSSSVLNDIKDNLFYHLVRVGLLSWSEWADIEGWHSRSSHMIHRKKQVEKLLDLDRFDRLECIKAFRDIKIGDSFRVVQPALCDWDAALCSGEVYMAFYVHAGNVDNFLIHKSKKR